MKYIGFIVGCSLASSVFAFDISLAGRLEALQTDNALKSSVNEVDEVQTRIGADLAVSHEASDVSFNLDYEANRSRYSEDSQEDETNLEGRSSLEAKLLNKTLITRLSHSRVQVLKEPNDIDLQINRDDRDVSTASLNWVVGSRVNSLIIYGQLNDIKYDELFVRDSKRVEGGITWRRRISKVSSFSLLSSYRDVTFESFDNADYEYYSASIRYSANLARLNYSLTVGGNEVRRGDAEESGGLFNLRAEYELPATFMSLYIGRSLTDSSFGDGNQEFLSSESSSVSSQSPDIMEYSSVEFLLRREMLCGTCSVSLTAHMQREDHENSLEDREILGGRLSFSYSPSRGSQIRLSRSYTDNEFDELSGKDAYKLEKTELSWSRKFGKSLSFRLFVDEVRRDEEGDKFYDGLSTGISLSYQLL
ncbi:MAG: hypothetical protein K6L73_01365 [Cellvibrionaceae bacterium]